MSWSIKPSDFINVVEADLAKRRTEILLYVHRSIVFRTPVDTGRARGSWAISYGFPLSQDSGSTSAGEVLSRGYQQAARRAQSPYEVAIVSSGLSYINDLESGTSQQAPSGMVGVTVVSAKARYAA